jgi:sec-independent protein translocase protein TatA
MIAFVNHWELLVILAVILLLFGHRLPGMARSLGSGITEFKRGLKDGSSKAKDDDPPSGGSGKQVTGGGDNPNDGSPR